MAAAVVEPLDRAQQAERALLDQVGQRQTVIARAGSAWPRARRAGGWPRPAAAWRRGRRARRGAPAAAPRPAVSSGVRAIRDRNDVKPSGVSDFMPSTFRAPPKGRARAAPQRRLNARLRPYPELTQRGAGSSHDRSAPLAARRPDRGPPHPRAGARPGARGRAAARRARSRPARLRRAGRFGAALAGGLVSATLVSAGAFGLGLVDTGDAPAAAPAAGERGRLRRGSRATSPRSTTPPARRSSRSAPAAARAPASSSTRAARS